MSWQAREKRRRDRERIALSVLSLLVLFLLLGGFVYLRASQEPVGKLTVVSTSQVTISVNEPPPPAVQEPAPAPEPPATLTPQRAAGRGPGIVSEVLGGGQAEPAAANRPNISTGGAQGAPGQASAQASATAVATATSAVRSGISLGGSGGGGSAPAATSTPGGGAPATSTPDGGAPAATSTPGGGAPATSTPGGIGGGSTPTPRPTRTSAPPTATPVPDEVTPLGHHSHLRIPGFVGPGAYETGGILVSNPGPVAFNYSLSMTTSGSAQFAALLRLRIYRRVGSSCNYPGPPASPGADLLPLIGDQVGTVLYDGNFGSGNKFGNPAVELAAGDRPLAVGQSEVLCMEVFFPWTAGNESQGQTVNGTLIFTAKSPE